MKRQHQLSNHVNVNSLSLSTPFVVAASSVAVSQNELINHSAPLLGARKHQYKLNGSISNGVFEANTNQSTSVHRTSGNQQSNSAHPLSGTQQTHFELTTANRTTAENSSARAYSTQTNQQIITTPLNRSVPINKRSIHSLSEDNETKTVNANSLILDEAGRALVVEEKLINVAGRPTLTRGESLPAVMAAPHVSLGNINDHSSLRGKANRDLTHGHPLVGRVYSFDTGLVAAKIAGIFKDFLI